MKKWSAVVVLIAGMVAPCLSQDAATQERLDLLRGNIQDLQDANKALQRQIADLTREVDRLRETIGQPNSAYATAEDLKRITDAIRTVDQKRIQDAERVQAELQKLARALSAPPPKAPRTPATTEEDKPPTPERFFRHKVEPGDTLSTIIAAYKEKGVKVTLDSILKANPGLKPERMPVGKEIIIPAP